MNTSLDRSNLRQVILDSINQIQHTFDIINPPDKEAEQISLELNNHFQEIVVAGMGGSALPAELYISAYQEMVGNLKATPLRIHRSYGDSLEISEKSLVMAISYSGNTEETISDYDSAVESGSPVVAIAAGGKLIQRAQELGKPYVVLPNPDPMFQPRYATLYILKAMLTVGVAYGALDQAVLDRFASALGGVSPKVFEQRGQELASLIQGKTPIIYSSFEYKVGAHLWKIKINENAKTPCFWNYFPELNHNEMVGYTNPQANFQFIFVKNESESDRNIKRMQVMNDLFQERGLSVEEVVVPNFNNHLANLISMILIGDWKAYYLALAYGIDPTPVDMVEDFKDKMKS